LNKPERRSAEEILLNIKNKARNYTPEWHFSADRSDIGVALSEVFSRMQSDTEKKYAQLTDKLCTDYFNCLDANVKPASPAEGYVYFEMSDPNVSPITLQKGTVLRTGSTDENGELVPAELTEDICVIPQTIKAVIETEGRSDYVGIIKGLSTSSEEEKSDEDGEDKGLDFDFFGKTVPNIQSHCFYISHPWVFPAGNSGMFEVSFVTSDGCSVSEDILNTLCDPNLCTIFFEGEEGAEIPFTNVTSTSHSIKIAIEQDISGWIETEKNEYFGKWIGFRINGSADLKDFGFVDIYVKSASEIVRPDIVYSENIDENESVCFPFGQRFTIFDEVYFGSFDALSKRGSEIELSFAQEFCPVPINADGDENSIDWKLIMAKSDLKEAKAYDISIEEVIWEYYNGYGWVKLFKDNANSKAFNTNKGLGRKMVKISFQCPEDISPILIGAMENYYIRARIRKVNNAYKTTGQYISPVISDVCFGYCYDERQIKPKTLLSVNNVNTRLYDNFKNNNTVINPVEFPDDKESCLYLGIDGIPKHGPVKFLFITSHLMDEIQPKLAFEYYTVNNEWTYLNMIDETECLKKTGIMTFSGMPFAKHINLYGNDLYWIRIRRLYPDDNKHIHPHIENIYVNGTTAKTVKTDIEETFTIEEYAPERTIKLMYGNIQNIDVWITEDSGISENEITSLKKAHRYKTEVMGEETRSYIKWTDTDNVIDLDSRDRVFLLDAGKGTLTFGKGSAGLLPSPEIQDSIKVKYSFGGGVVCNLEANSVTGLDSSNGYISLASNPVPFNGGFNKENKEEALIRAKREQKHRFHAVTKDDYEYLIFESSRNILKVRCLPSIDPDGKVARGFITIAILMNDYNNQKSFISQKYDIQKYLSDKLPIGMVPGKNFIIREPKLVEISVFISAEIADYHDTLNITADINEKLTSFIDPVTGGFSGKGWDIGSFPTSTQLSTVIHMVPGVDNIQKLYVFAKILNEPGTPSVDIEQLKKDPFVLAVSGEHHIQLTEHVIRR